MFTINDDKSIYVTRGDVCFFAVSAEQDGVAYTFQPKDTVRIKVTSKKDAETVLMQKSFVVEEETDRVEIYLTGDDTKFGDVISKATDYWYEIELNPFTNPQTIIGFDEDGAKIFKLFPEGDDVEYVEEEDVPVVDAELSLTSERPIQNQAVARALILYEERVAEAQDTINATADEAEQRVTETAEATKTEINSYANNAIARVESAESDALGSIDDAEADALQNVENAKKSALQSVSSAESNAVQNIGDTKDTAITKIKAEADSAEQRAKNASDSATASATRARAEADRAKAEADRASGLVGGDFATNEKVDCISTSVTGWFEAPGWYRVAEYPISTENDGKGISSNGCTLVGKQRYSSLAGDYFELKLLSVHGNQEFKCIASRSATTNRGITKVRYTYDAEKAYLEVYYNLSVANQIHFEITHPKDRMSSWETINTVMTSETLDGVTVTTTYDIPVNANPVNSEDLEAWTFEKNAFTDATAFRKFIDGYSANFADNTSYEMWVAVSYSNDAILGSGQWKIIGNKANATYESQMAVQYRSEGVLIKGRSKVNGTWNTFKSLSDADTLDGHDSEYFATAESLKAQIADFGTDLNDCIDNGIYFFSGNATNYTNVPDSSANNGIMRTYYYSDTRIVQRYTSITLGITYERVCGSNGWKEWGTLATLADLANYFKNTGGTISGDVIFGVSTNTTENLDIKMLNSLKNLLFRLRADGSSVFYDSTNNKAIAEFSADGTNYAFNGEARGSLCMNGYNSIIKNGELVAKLCISGNEIHHDGNSAKVVVSDTPLTAEGSVRVW